MTVFPKIYLTQLTLILAFLNIFGVILLSPLRLINTHALPLDTFYFDVTRVITKDNTPELEGDVWMVTGQFDSETNTFPITVEGQNLVATMGGHFEQDIRPWTAQVISPISDGNYNVIGGNDYGKQYNNESLGTDLTVDTTGPSFVSVSEPLVSGSPQTYSINVSDLTTGIMEGGLKYAYIGENDLCDENVVFDNYFESEISFDITNTESAGARLCFQAIDQVNNISYYGGNHILSFGGEPLTPTIYFTIGDDVDQGPTPADIIRVNSELESVWYSIHETQSCESQSILYSIYPGELYDERYLPFETNYDHIADFPFFNGYYICFTHFDGEGAILQQEISAYPFNILVEELDVDIDVLETFDTTPTLTGTYSLYNDTPLSSIIVNVNGVDYEATFAEGNWTVDITTPLEYGQYEASVTATNENNVSDSDFEPLTIKAPLDDNDGVSVDEENGVPNEGDGNNDGLLDSEQSNVASFLSADEQTYVTIVSKDHSGEACSISTVTVDSENSFINQNSNNIADSEYDFVYGINGFTASCSEAHITVIWHTVLPQDMRVYRKFVPLTPGNELTNMWTTYPTTFTDIELNGQTVTKAEFVLKDGELGDRTGVDGVIYDPGGVGRLANPVISQDQPVTTPTPTPNIVTVTTPNMTIRTGGTTDKFTLLMYIVGIFMIASSSILPLVSSKKLD